ncbi:Acetyl esterase/lipase [Agromyces cerinus subsp. cerinus]|uniref:Acetyl esterase/lipase n=2 Tax=Agromyces cerinus TaxID=33878 RepID=A0A1N6GPJ9_9MICO|nr:Acetyl esterase/lipase [Agromyces cerinus subsp. cerinus]
MSTMMLDPQIAAMYRAMAENLQSLGDFSPPARGDVHALRAMIDGAMPACPAPPSTGVSVRQHVVASSQQGRFELRWYEPETSQDDELRPAVVYLHGGGMVAGKAEYYDGLVRYYVEQTRVPFASVDYRLAPENPGTGMATDAVDAIAWLIEHADEFGIDPQRIAVMGDSGGGGVAAGAAILARDRGIALARQLLIYPMLDDRTTVPDPNIAPYAAWDWDSNWTCWSAVLGAGIGGDSVSPIAAPARLTEFGGLPPAYIEVGDLDIFRDESISYAQRLHAAGISCELHVLPGVTHGHDRVSVEIDVSRRTLAARCRVLAAL